jgi:hypothetical protein
MDALELDVLLSEVTLMHTRAELYMRFLRRRIDSTTDQNASPTDAAHDRACDERRKMLDVMLNQSKLGTRIQVSCIPDYLLVSSRLT